MWTSLQIQDCIHFIRWDLLILTLTIYRLTSTTYRCCLILNHYEFLWLSVIYSVHWCSFRICK